MPLPLKKITDCGEKPLPFTVSTNPGEPAGMLGGVSDVSLGLGIIRDAFAARSQQQRRHEYQPILERTLPLQIPGSFYPKPGHLEPARTRVGARRSGNWNRRDY